MNDTPEAPVGALGGTHPPVNQLLSVFNGVNWQVWGQSASSDPPLVLQTPSSITSESLWVLFWVCRTETSKNAVQKKKRQPESEDRYNHPSRAGSCRRRWYRNANQIYCDLSTLP